MGKTFFIIAGEASGDRHAADLVRAIQELRPDCRFIGIGGDCMRQEGVELIYPMSDLAVLGIVEIFRHLPTLYRIQNDIKRRLQKAIDAVILVDYPGFNLRIARMAGRMGIPVIYYICPQLWAWGQKRVEKIRKYVDLPLVIFQFEQEFFARFGIRAHWVGHPLVDQLRRLPSEAEFRKNYGLPTDKPLVALLPGSRRMEVERLLPVMCAAMQDLTRPYGLLPVIGKPVHLENELYHRIVGRRYPILERDIGALMKYAHFALVASGTATLELAFLQTPMVVLYRVSPVTYYMGRLLIKLNTIALANIVAGRPVVPELIQHRLTPERVRRYAQQYLDDSAYYNRVKAGLAQIPEILGPPGASRRAARHIVEFLP